MLIPIRDWNFSVGFDFYAIDIVALAIAVIYVLKLVIRPIKLQKTGKLLIFGLLIGLLPSLFSVFLGGDFFIHGLLGWAKLLVYYLVALAFLSSLRDENFKNEMVKFQLTYFIVLAVLALVNFITIGLDDADFIGDFFDRISIRGQVPFNHLQLSFWTRNTSFAGEPNFLAIYALLHYGIVLSARLNQFKRVLHVLLLSLVVISTFSRIALLLLPILILLHELKLNFRLVLGYLMLAILIWFGMGRIHNVGDYITEISKSILARDFSGDQGRIKIYKEALTIWQGYPLGVGISNYGMASFDIFGPSGEPNPHNGFLTLLVEQGILGLTAKLFLYAHLLRQVFKHKGVFLFFSMSLILTSVFVNNFDKILGFDLFFILVGYERFSEI